MTLSLPLSLLMLDMTFIGVLLMLCTSALKISAGNHTLKLFAALCASTICFIVRSRQEYAYWIPEDFRFGEGFLSMPLDVAQNAYQGIFMLFAFSLFNEKQAFPRWLAGAFGLQLVLECIAHYLSPSILAENYNRLSLSLASFTLYKLTMLLQIAFALLSMFWILSDWRSDLVERRRQIRLVLLAYQGFFSIATLSLYRLLTHIEGFPIQSDLVSSYHMHVVITACSGIFMFVVGMFLLKFDASLLLQAPVEVSQPELASPQDAQGERDWTLLDRAFREEKIYYESGLTLSSLASKLAIPEYRLRKLINSKLGYSNFNAYLHEFRIRDACQELANPEKNNIPILTIALSVGYQSINSFNRAFKATKGCTPSEYRAQTLLLTTQNNSDINSQI